MARVSLAVLAGGAIAVAAACGSKDPPKSPADEPTATTTDREPRSAEGEAKVIAEEQKKKEFDNDQAQVVLKRAATGAATCPDVTPEGPFGTVRVSVTFAGAGRSTDASVPPPWAGKPIGSCVSRAFIGMIIPPFEGPDHTVYINVDLKEPGKGTPKKK